MRAMLDPSSRGGQKIYRDRLATEIEVEAERAVVTKSTLGQAKRDLDIQLRPRGRAVRIGGFAPEAWARLGEPLPFCCERLVDDLAPANIVAMYNQHAQKQTQV